jgi:uncharacterized protein with HEPN domain
MPKDDWVYVGHMLDMGRKVVEKTSSNSRAQFDANENLRLAVTHLLQIIGEAASHVSSDFRNQHEQIPWKAIIGMRQKVVHDYMNVDEDIVWDTARSEVPSLVELLEAILPLD